MTDLDINSITAKATRVKDHENEDEEITREMRGIIERRKYAVPHDPRVTSVLAVISMIMAALATAAIIALFTLNSSVAVLLARPVGVPREEYTRDTLRRDDDSNSLKIQMAELRASIEKLREDELTNTYRRGFNSK